MSGGGGTGGSPRDPEVSCEEIDFKTVIATPNKAIIASLKIDELLDVKIVDQKIVVLKDKNIVGSIIESVSNLMRCLQEGYSYIAKILKIDDGKITIQVRSQFELGS